MEDIQGRMFRILSVDYNCRYPWDLDRAEIVFYRKNRPVAQADLQVIGSISGSSGTWLWGWANEDIPPKAKVHLSEVKRYGEEQGFQKLSLPEWIPDDASDGHDMMYVAASVLGASAVFHDHVGDLALFCTLHNFRAPSDRANV